MRDWDPSLFITGVECGWIRLTVQPSNVRGRREREPKRCARALEGRGRKRIQELDLEATRHRNAICLIKSCDSGHACLRGCERKCCTARSIGLGASLRHGAER